MKKLQKGGKTMVFLFGIILMIILSIVLLIFSKIGIEVIDFKFSSQTKRYFNQDYKVILKLYAFGCIPIFKMTITKEKLEKIKVKEKIENIDVNMLQKDPFFHKELLDAIKKVKIEIEKLNLNIEIGTENVILTAILVPVVSTIIAILLRKNGKCFENQIFIVSPVYQNKNLVNIAISGIFEMEMRHIITIIYRLIKKAKKGGKKYERTSHRRAYDYGYE